MGPTWGHQDPGGPHVDPANLAIRDAACNTVYSSNNPCGMDCVAEFWDGTTQTACIAPQGKGGGIITCFKHYNDVIMSTSLTIVYSTVYSGVNQQKHQSSASLVFVWGIHRWPVNSRHKRPVTRKMFPFDDVIIQFLKFSNAVNIVHKYYIYLKNNLVDKIYIYKLLSITIIHWILKTLQWRNMSIMVSQSIATIVCTSNKLVNSNNNNNNNNNKKITPPTANSIKAPHHWPFARGTSRHQ